MPEEELAGPVERFDRVASLDVLRGFALLGIVMINIQDFGFTGSLLENLPLEVVQRTGSHLRSDVAVTIIQWLFFEGRMRTLFSVLFGAGTVLLLERIERRAGASRAADIFHRRNMWLMVAGLIHGFLIWWGDILFYYGVLALLFLYPLRHLSGRRLASWGFAISLIGGTFGMSNSHHIPEVWPVARLQERAAADTAAHRPLSLAEHQAMDDAAAKRRNEIRTLHGTLAAAHAGYLASEPGNVAAETQLIGYAFRTGRLFEVLGMMIAGMGMYKIGFLSALWSSRAYAAIAAGGYLVSSTVTLVGLAHASRFGFSDAVTDIWLLLPYDVGAISGMLANASLLLLLIRHRRLLPVQRALAAVGRTALSNYLLTSLICQSLTSWLPWKLYGQLEYYQLVYVVAVVWVFNISFSLLWTRTFAIGPFEWVWRSLTYWQRQRFLLSSLA